MAPNPFIAIDRGTNGLILGYAIVCIGLYGGLILGRAGMKKYLLAPLFAVALVVFAGTFFTSGVMVLGIGFVAGRVASQRLPDLGHKRGTVIADGTEAQKLAVNL